MKMKAVTRDKISKKLCGRKKPPRTQKHRASIAARMRGNKNAKWRFIPADELRRR